MVESDSLVQGIHSVLDQQSWWFDSPESAVFKLEEVEVAL
jgi:hypothetical protein